MPGVALCRLPAELDPASLGGAVAKEPSSMSGKVDLAWIWMTALLGLISWAFTGLIDLL